jgi:ribonuclease HII
MTKLKKYLNKSLTEAGCDEAGRGCLAGPVFAAAVILPENFDLPLLNDSKKLSKKTRYELREKIVATAKSWAVACVDNKTIDKINILNASILAMHKAIKKLDVEPGFLLIDGNRFKPYKSIPHSCIIKGDGKFCAIAAASILAKTYRDDFMKKIHSHFPEYDWVNNKGYPTAKHRKTISENGITPYHRKTFRSPPHTL